MIYISRGYTTNRMKRKPTETDDFTAIMNSKVKVFDDINDLESIKKKSAPYFIAGDMARPSRSDENLLSRSLVVLDYDDLDMTEEAFKTHLKEHIGDFRFYGYPSIRHGLKGLRYRVIIDVDRPYTQEESGAVIQFMTNLIALEYDKSSNTWSQLQGLKTSFESKEAFEDKCLYNAGSEVLQIDSVIKAMPEYVEQKPQDKLKTPPVGMKKFTATFMEELLGGVDDGNRNVWLTKQFGRMLSLGFDATTAYQWIELINREFVRPPLEDRTVNTIVLSIAKKEKRRYTQTGEG